MNLPGMEYQFYTSTFIYYKTDVTAYLDQTFGDIHCDIVDREAAIFRELEQQVTAATPAITRISQSLATLDWCFSLTEVSVALPKRPPSLGTTRPP